MKDKIQTILLGHSPRWFLALGVLLMIPGLSGCDRILGGGHANLDRMEVFLHGTAPEERVATWTRSGGWDVASLPTLSLSASGGRLSLGTRVFDEDGSPVRLTLGGEYFMRYRLAPGAAEGVLNMGLPAQELFFGDRVVLVARGTGATTIRFSLFHVNHSDGDTTPITVTVIP
jgi:hypothetical protein